MNSELKSVGVPYAFRYRPDNDYALDEIENNYIYFPNRDELKDPFDSSPTYLRLNQSEDEMKLLREEILSSIVDPEIEAYINDKDGLENLQKVALDKLEEFILSFGIACFSMYQANYNLWANYANGHKGICLQYNIDYDLDFFHNLLPVFYVSELKKIEFKPISQPNGLVDLFYYKLDIWSAEKELRLIKSNPGKHQHNKKALRNIIIGFDAHNDYVDKILSMVRTNYEEVGVYQMKKPKEPNQASYILLN